MEAQVDAIVTIITWGMVALLVWGAKLVLDELLASSTRQPTRAPGARRERGDGRFAGGTH